MPGSVKMPIGNLSPILMTQFLGPMSTGSARAPRIRCASAVQICLQGKSTSVRAALAAPVARRDTTDRRSRNPTPYGRYYGTFWWAICITRLLLVRAAGLFVRDTTGPASGFPEVGFRPYRRPHLPSCVSRRRCYPEASTEWLGPGSPVMSRSAGVCDRPQDRGRTHEKDG